MDWLSVYSETVLPRVSGMLFRIHNAKISPTISASYVLCFSGVPKKACNVLSWFDLPFLYSIAAEPIPLLTPEPSKKILKSALSCFSASIDSFLDDAIVVEYLAAEVIEVAGLIVSIVMLLRLNHFRSELIRLRCFVGGICFASWRIRWSGW